MIQFANAKINLGLHVTNKRADGYHDLETVFYPIKLYDAIEVTPSDKVSMVSYGMQLEDENDNLCLKAYYLLAQQYPLSPVEITLLKKIPIGAGLGGGSSDATHMLKILNEQFDLNISDEILRRYASQLGADCPFFVANKPVYATGIGDQFEEIDLDLSVYHIVVVKPDVFVSTREAYQEIKPKNADFDLTQLSALPVESWRDYVKNDFEEGIFKLYPEIEKVKEKLYADGALYASMSGSGSAFFGIFDKKPKLDFSGMSCDVFYALDL